MSPLVQQNDLFRRAADVEAETPITAGVARGEIHLIVQDVQGVYRLVEAITYYEYGKLVNLSVNGINWLNTGLGNLCGLVLRHGKPLKVVPKGNEFEGTFEVYHDFYMDGRFIKRENAGNLTVLFNPPCVDQHGKTTGRAVPRNG